MDEDLKRRFDSLAKIYDTAWNNFHTRRGFEWKLNMALWTAYAAFLGIVITNKIPPSTWVIFILSGVINILVAYSYIQWIIGLGRANRADVHIAIECEREMLQMAEFDYSDSLNNYLKQLNSKTGLAKNWSMRFQWTLTLILGFASILCLWP